MLPVRNYKDRLKKSTFSPQKLSPEETKTDSSSLRTNIFI